MTDTAHPYLDEMPAAPCPPGCVVRKGDRIGSVTHNDGERWAVTEHGVRHGRIGTSHGGRGTPEAAGWRHAIDLRGGFAYVFDEVLLRIAKKGPAAAGPDLDMWGLVTNAHRIRDRQLDRTLTDADLILVARAFSAVLR